MFLSFILAYTPKPASNSNDSIGSLIGELQSLLKELCVDGYSMMPKRFLHALQKSMGNMLHIAEQNDLPEFLMLLIDRLCTDIGTPLDPALLQQADQEIQRAVRQNNAIAHLTWCMEQNWLKHNARDSSPLKDMFYGQQVMQTRCDACQYLGHNHETFFMLSLGLPSPPHNLPGQPDSTAPASQASQASVRISELIADHVKSEAVMDGIWRCDGCKFRGQSCTTTVRLWKLPKILVVVLKRFAQVPMLRKLHTRIQLDQARVLDMSDHSIRDADSTYDLMSIACHMGSVHGGHYYAICRNIHHQKWFRIDDLQVTEITDPATHLASAERDAYVLFYQLRQSRVDIPGPDPGPGTAPEA